MLASTQKLLGRFTLDKPWERLRRRHVTSDVGAYDALGSLSTRTFQDDAATVERLRLGRGLLRMTFPGLPTSRCRRRRESSCFGGVVKLVSNLAVFNVFIVSSPFSSSWYDFNQCSANFWHKLRLSCPVLSGWNDHRNRSSQIHGA